MKTIKTVAILMISLSFFASCKNSSSENVVKDDISNVQNLENNSVSETSVGGVSEQINEAAKKNKAVFLVVFNKEGAEKEKTLSIAKEAAAKNPKTIQVIELNTSDNANSELVTKYRLTGAPLPLIIVLDKNGIAAGGLVLADATVDGLLKIIPSPKYSEILKALNNQKAIFIVVYKQTMPDKAKAIENCKKTVESMNNGASVVELNIDNKNEEILITQLKVNTLATDPVIYAINKAGQVTGTFDINTSTADLKNAANKVIKSSGCCPGGSGSSGCGTKK